MCKEWRPVLQLVNTAILYHRRVINLIRPVIKRSPFMKSEHWATTHKNSFAAYMPNIIYKIYIDTISYYLSAMLSVIK